MKKTVSKLAVLLIFLSLLLTGCKDSQVEVKEPELLKPVNAAEKTETVQYRDIYDIAPYRACVVPYTQDLYFDNNGVFDQFYVALGDKVKKGQILAKQNTTQLELQLKELEKNYEDIQSDYEDQKKLGEIDLEIIDVTISKRTEDLKLATGAQKADIEYEIAKLKLNKKDIQDLAVINQKVYEEQIASCKKKIELVKSSIANCMLVSPCDGNIVNIRTIKKEDEIGNSIPVVKIGDNSRIYIKCDSNILQTIETAADYYAEFNGKKYDINLLGNTVNILNQSEENMFLEVFFTLKNKQDKLSVGDSGLIYLKFNPKDKVLSLRKRSVYIEGIGKSYVYRLKNKTKEKVYITTGLQTQLYIEIISGLEEGDVVVNE